MLRLSALATVVTLAVGCGGGSGSSNSNNGSGNTSGGGGGGSGSQNPDFSISVSPNPLALDFGTGGAIDVSVTPMNGFKDPVQVMISGAPAGLILSETQFSLTAQQNVTVGAGTTLSAGDYALKVQGTAGTLVHSTTARIQVGAAPPLPSRADFVRTDDTPFAAAYDMARKLVYVSNPNIGTVDVISSTTYQLLNSIPIPSPAGLDMSPDGSTVFVGTSSQALYTIDAATQKISQRYVAPSGQRPTKIKVAANGSVLMLTESISGVFIASWNLTTNTFTVRTDAPKNFFDTTGVLARSGNGQEVIFANDFDPGTVILYDSATDSFTAADVPSYPFAVAANADGTQFTVAVDGYGTYVYDAQLNLRTILAAAAPLQFNPGNDFLYAVGFLGNVPVVQTINMQTYRSAGFAPAYATNIAYFERLPPLIEEKPLVADETGRVFGAADHGLAIDDAKDRHPYTGNEPFPIYNIAVDPAEGPAGRQQNVQIRTQSYTTPPEIWFGPIPATDPQTTGPYLTATVPGIASAGPVNVRLIDKTGVQSWIPQAYSFGTTFASNPEVAASSAGGGTLNLFGYGLGVLAAKSGTQVTLGASSATVTSSDYAAEQAYPFPLEQLQIQPPAMGDGSYDVNVSSTTGTAVLKGAYHSVEMTSYKLDGQPLSIVYDAKRQQVYLSTAKHVEVFSLTSKKFLTPIKVPTLNNDVQLGGMAITPDGATLLVTNWADGSVALVDPDNPANSKAVAIVPPGNSTPWEQGPSVVAATNNGKAFINAAGSAYGFPQFHKRKRKTLVAPSNGGPLPSIWELDLTTLIATPVTALSASPPDSNVSIKASDDGSEICFTGEYQPLSLYESASDSFTQGSIQGFSTCAIGENSVVMSSYPATKLLALSDTSLDFNGYASMPDYAAYSLVGPLTPIALGSLVDPSGALAYQTTIQEIALVDAHTGQLRERIALPMKTQFIYDGAIARDQTGLEIFAITDSGLTVIQLDNLPMGVGNIKARGTTWTISGTGFRQGVEAYADGVRLNTSFINSQTVQIIGAPSLNNIEELSFVNPDGRSYAVAAAHLR
ncbi:MAG TPA: YncE family protein [Terriglobales bacterium]